VRNAFTIRSENLKGRDHSEVLGIDGKIILEWILGEKCGRCGLIHTAHDRDRWQTLVSSVRNLRFPQMAENFLTRSVTVGFSRRILLHGVIWFLGYLYLLCAVQKPACLYLPLLVFEFVSFFLKCDGLWGVFGRLRFSIHRIGTYSHRFEIHASLTVSWALQYARLLQCHLASSACTICLSSVLYTQKPLHIA
jgi:hypothetical protein